MASPSVTCRPGEGRPSKLRDRGRHYTPASVTRDSPGEVKSPQAERDKGRWPRGGPRTRGPAPGMPRRPGGACATRSLRSTLGRAEGRGREDIARFPRLARARSRQQKHAKRFRRPRIAQVPCKARAPPRPTASSLQFSRRGSDTFATHAALGGCDL